MPLVHRMSQVFGRHSNFIFHSISFLFNRGIPFIASLIVANFLSVADFGRYITVISLFFSLCLVVDLGFALATAKTVARRAKDPTTAASAILAALLATAILGLTMSAAIGVGAEEITHIALGDQSLRAAVLAGALYVPASALASTATAALQGAQRYRELAMAGFVGGGIFLALVTIAALKADALSVIWMASFGAIARMLVLMIAVAPLVSLAKLGAQVATRLKSDLRELWRVALPASVAAFTFVPVNTLLIATLYRGPNGAVEAGCLGLALQVFSIVMILPGMLTQYALPKFAGLTDDHRQFRRRAQLRQFTMLAIAITFVIAIPIAIGAPLLLNYLAPPYVDGYLALRWMMVAALFAAPQGVFSNYLMAQSYDWIRVFTRLLWAAVVLGSILAFPHLDALGMAMVYAAAWATILTSQLIVVAVVDRPR